MHKSLQNGNAHRTGYSNGSPKKPPVRIVGVITFAALVTLYVFACLSSSGYVPFMGHLGSDSTSWFDYINSTEPIEKEGYLVYSPSCRIPDTPPFHESIKSFYSKQKPISCSDHPLLTSVSWNKSHHILHLHKRHFHLYSKTTKVSCCYNLIIRKDLAPDTKVSQPDNTLNYSKCLDLEEDISFSGVEQFIRVQCHTQKGNTTTNVYTNLHAFIGIHPQVKRKMADIDSTVVDQHERPLGVMIIGIDSISRLNLLRTMPKTAKHLEETGWYTLKGYNKMDDNTFPNLMAILTGMTLKQVRKTCYPTNQTPVERCPLIWKNFSNAGYITAYAEDMPSISTFNYQKVGFITSPTDYYLRPFMLAAAASTKSKSHSGLTICHGPEKAANHIMNYSLDLASVLGKYPTFSLFWMNGFSHNDLNTPTTMDDDIVQYLDRLNSTGVLNSTMVIFLSDHGIRFGAIRQTYIGYIEERLPYIYFSLPDWFKTLYPAKVANLVRNSYRLTSPFDVYLTLTEVLNSPVGAMGCPNCQSLFEEVPWNRSCIDAGITDRWCTCSEYKTLSTEAGPVQAIARFVIAEINQIATNHTTFVENGTKCATLKAKQVHSIRSKIFSQSSGYEEYVILVEATPGNGLFEATIAHKYNFKVMGSISRINSYEQQSRCMNDSFGKNYCICQDIKPRSNPTKATTQQTKQ